MQSYHDTHVAKPVVAGWQRRGREKRSQSREPLGFGY
jgi:hypothetical protein